MLIILLFFASSCSPEAPRSTTGQDVAVGTYNLVVEDFKRAKTGKLEIAGEPGDYFGRLTLDADPPRIYALGLVTASADSLSFRIPGGGAVELHRGTSGWEGSFRYFRLRATLRAVASGPPPADLVALVQPKPIAPGIISTPGQETFPTLSPDGLWLYFTRDGTIMKSRRKGSGWSAPDTAVFSGEHADSAPYFGPDGDVLLFTSNRPPASSAGSPDRRRKKDLWLVQRNAESDWTTPEPLPAPVNIDSLGEYHGALARNGIVYFVSYARPGGFGRSDLYRAEPMDSGYRVENLGAEINTEASEADVYVDPDERFILLAATNLPGSFGADDIYISYRREAGWTKPRNLGGAVNSFAYEYAPWVDRSEGFLYFTSFRRGSADLYRVPLSDVGL